MLEIILQASRVMPVDLFLSLSTSRSIASILVLPHHGHNNIESF